MTSYKKTKKYISMKSGKPNMNKMRKSIKRKEIIRNQTEILKVKNLMNEISNVIKIIYSIIEQMEDKMSEPEDRTRNNPVRGGQRK